jgi:hypothetical protein
MILALELKANLVTEIRTTKKLIPLNDGNIKFSKPTEGYVILTKTIFTPEQKQYLNLGLDSHCMTKHNMHSKRVENEVLLNDILNLEHDNND